MDRKLLLVDGNSLLHRAFHALPPLQTGSGEYTNAVYGFATMLLRVLEEEEPTHLAVAFDKGRKTFRHDIYGEYKGTRKPTAPELRPQFALARELLGALGVPYLEKDDYEADDLIGTLARQAAGEGIPVRIVTGDRDALQLVGPAVRVLLTRKGIRDTELCDEEAIRERYGVSPGQLVDVKALMGDSSDNIPGVPGVGEKTALKLIREYGSLEGVYAHLGELSGARLVQNLRDHREQATLSYRLGQIDTRVPLEGDLSGFVFGGIDSAGAVPVLSRLEFSSLLRRLGGAGERPAPAETAPGGAPGSLPVETFPETGGFCARLGALEADLSVHWEWGPDGPGMDFSRILVCDGTVCLDHAPADEGEAPRRACLQALLGRPGRRVTSHQAKPLVLLALQESLPVAGIDDLSLMAHLLASDERDYTLELLCPRYLEGMACPEDGPGRVQAVARLAERLRERLRDEGLEALYRDLEQPLLGVLCRMEQHGIRLDVPTLEDMETALAGRIAAREQEIHQECGVSFNINSPRQLAEVLFGRLGLPPLKKTKTGYSTDAEVLERLRPEHPVIERILDYRQLVKLQTTYVGGLLSQARQGGGVVHTTYHQTMTATGRLSSSDPNLQNIPIRMEEGRLIRRAFRPVDPENLLLAADYSQIELRVLAHLSGDPKLREAYRERRDIHTITASEVFGIPPEKVNAGLRRKAKAVNFGIVYGISDFGLARDLNIPPSEAAAYIERYFERYPGVADFLRTTVEQARRDGTVTTILGRKRRIRDIGSRNYNVRSAAERMAVNTPVQGSAADIIKRAMLAAEDRLRQGNYRARLVLQVHDELILEVPPGELQAVGVLLREVMEQALELAVPLVADLSAGATWYDMERIQDAGTAGS